MIPYMLTSHRLTILDPKGSSPLVFSTPTSSLIEAALEIIKKASLISHEETWSQLKRLHSNTPLGPLSSWFEAHGIHLKEEGKDLLINSIPVPKTLWLPFFEKVRKSGGLPINILMLAEKLQGSSSDFSEFNPLNYSFHIASQFFGGADQLRLVVPFKSSNPQINVGDEITFPTPLSANSQSTAKAANLLLSCDVFTWDIDTFSISKGAVLEVVEVKNPITDILEQPFILGANRTYLVQEELEGNWEEAYSSDSLQECILYAEMLADSYRLINRQSNQEITT